MVKVEKSRYSDRCQYLMRAVYARRKKVRLMAVEYKGGKCEICGYGRCIEAIVCANCHRELHAKLAASGGNSGVKKRVNSGKAREIGSILSQVRRSQARKLLGGDGKVQRLDTRCLIPETVMAKV